MGKAMASPKRLELLDLLAQGERTVEALATAAAMGVTNTSAHLQVLRHGGLVTARKQGTRVYYRLPDDDVARFTLRFRDLARARLADVEQAGRDYFGPAEDVQPVTRDELLARLRTGDVTVVDVRPPEEYAAGHIAGALSVPLDELEARLAELPADTGVVAYCRGPFCVYSSQAVRMLREHGHQARRLQDGFPEWRLAGLPTGARRPAPRRAIG
ncbi:MAG: metalloregulator ArsR/SmtB family transcription factor [Actinomycetota bacterium]|nr:metalloregulator ArsR/SmtB family transcription factor [Actinomycetota bacterium]